MSVKFFKIPEVDKRYEKQIKKIREDCFESGLLDNDEFWLNKIFKYLFEYYNCNIDERKDVFLKSEIEIKKHMYRWFLKNTGFLSTFTVNLETLSQDTGQAGFDDIKFQSQFWGGGKKYFVVECKILTGSKQSIDRYIYRRESKTKNGEIFKYVDGGLYRYLTNKYAANQRFGGMLGFVQKGDIIIIINELKKNIETLQLTTNNEKKYGRLIDKQLLSSLINSNKNTFQSNHIRWDKDRDKLIDPVHIYHIFFDFT